MKNIKLVGYSSEESTKVDFSSFYKSKEQKNREKRNKLLIKEKSLELDEWFVYLVDGEKWYFKASQDLQVLRQSHVVEFLGIGRPNKEVHKPNPSKINKIVSELKDIDYGRCCYCQVKLTYPDGITPTSKTSEHIIPRNRGGKLTKPCCYECNQEKGGLMLHSYIQYLNYLLGEYKGELLEKVQRKIKNANEIARELESKQLNK